MTARTDTAATGGHDLLTERSFAAPRALVFRIWEQREHMIRWLGPTDFTCTHLEWELRPGAAWRACIASDATGESWMAGRIRETGGHAGRIGDVATAFDRQGWHGEGHEGHDSGGEAGFHHG